MRDVRVKKTLRIEGGVMYFEEVSIYEFEIKIIKGMTIVLYEDPEWKLKREKKSLEMYSEDKQKGINPKTLDEYCPPEYEEIILLNTGLKKSISREGSFDFVEGGYFPTEDSEENLQLIKNASEFLGTEITVIAGNDFFEEYRTVFDYKKSKAAFSHAVSDGSVFTPYADLKSIGDFCSANLYTAKFKVKNRKYQMLINSASRFSYLPKGELSEKPMKGEEEEYFIGHPFKKFTTPVREMTVKLGESKFTANFGVLPDEIESYFFKNGISGIIGSDFFSNFTVYYYPSSHSISYFQYKND